MADNVRRIVAEFSARNKAKGVMGGFRRDMDTTGRAMRRLATGALALAGVGGLGYMIKRQMETIDATAKLSDRLGVATEKLIGLQHAASITGTNAETLNKSLEIFTRRLGEMTQGSGEAKRGLDMLGLTAEQLIHISPAEAFGVAADKIKQLGTQAEKTAAAYFLFGRAGSKMLNMLEVGSQGLGEFQKEVEKLGLTFSRLDAAKVEAANDALTRARATMTGLFRTATIELAPYIEILADKFVDFATAGEGMGANVVNAFESMSMGAIRFGGLIQTIPAYWKGVEAAAHESLAVFYDVADAATNLDVLFKKMKLPKWEKTYKELAQEQRQIAAGLLEQGGRKLAGTYGQENAVERFYDNLRKKAAGQPDFITTFPEVIKFEREPFSWEKKPQEITEEQRKAAEEIDKVWTEMWLKQEETAYHAMRAPIIAAEELARASAERRKRIAEDIALSMARSWTTANDQMMFEGKEFWDAMTDMARGLIREIANIIIYKKIAEPMAYAFMGLPLLGGGGGGGGAGRYSAGAGTMYQYGGIATRPHLAMVGEVPEAIVPLSGGRSIPVEMRGGGGEKSLDVHIHNEQGEDREISRVESYMVSDQRIVDVFTRKAQTDGPLRRSIKQASR